MEIGDVAICVGECDELDFSITNGKQYTIEYANSNLYGIINDSGEYLYYDRWRFISLQKYRMDIINEILE